MNYKMPLTVAMLFLVVIFTLQNTEQMNINFLFWHATLSRALMIFIVLTVGLLVGWSLGTMHRKRIHAGQAEHQPAAKKQDTNSGG